MALIWVRGIGGSGEDYSKDLEIDPQGNIVHTGYFSGTVNFNPGQGTENLSTFGGTDIFVQKLSSNGDFIWAKNMGGTASDVGEKLYLDANGNVYATGEFSETADFNPNNGSAKITAKLQNDIFAFKLDSSGNYQWAKGFGSNRNDYVEGIISDLNGNTYLTGNFSATIDVNPGDAIFNLTPAAPNGFQDDYFVVKLKKCSPISGNDVLVACNSYTWIDGNTLYRIEQQCHLYTPSFKWLRFRSAFGSHHR